MQLEGKIAVVTGGNSGIGLATATGLARRGASVVIFGRNADSLALAEQTLAEAAGSSDRVLSVRGDVKRIADIDRIFQVTKKRFGAVDVLVANAGIGKFAPLADFSEELFDEIVAINLKGAFFTVQRALGHLADGAAVVLVASADAGKIGMPMNSVYSASKAAVISLARSFAVELLDRAIRVNVVSPGMTDTPIIERSGGDTGGMTPEQVAEGITRIIPLRRRAEAEEIAEAILFLVQSRYCLGAEIVVDGGLSHLLPPPRP